MRVALSIMRSSVRTFSFLLLLATVPAITSFLIALVLHISGYRAQMFWSTGPATTQTLDDLMQMCRTGGALGVSIVSLAFIGNFGIVAVCAVIAARWMNWRRVSCFYVVSVVILATASLRSTGIFGDLLRGYWAVYVLLYPPYMLPIALIAGGLLAALPIFKPGKRYWLRRGMCPKCQYDLQHKIDQGCPECGWNRVGE